MSAQQVQSGPGPAHGDWQDVQFLAVSWPPGRNYDDPRRTRTYVGDRNSRYALWTSPAAGDTAVFLVRGGSTIAEAWPKDTDGVGCR